MPHPSVCLLWQGRLAIVPARQQLIAYCIDGASLGYLTIDATLPRHRSCYDYRVSVSYIGRNRGVLLLYARND